MTNLLIMAGLIWGFCGSIFGGGFWLASPDLEVARRGRTMLLICAPMWAIAYHCLPLLGGNHP